MNERTFRMLVVLQKPSSLRRLRSAFKSIILWAFVVPSISLADDRDNFPQRWPDMQQMFYHGNATFDKNMVVLAPENAEDPMHLPVTIDASGLDKGKIEKILVVADYNPILKVLEFEPGELPPYLEFRMKIQQSTPIRAGAYVKNKGWFIGSAFVSSAGGGCTAPSVGSTSTGWEDQLNQVQTRIFDTQALRKLKFLVKHPMDTGLADGIPAFFIDELHFSTLVGSNESSAILRPYEPVSEDPIFGIRLPKGVTVKKIAGRDNNGNKIKYLFN